MKIHVTCRSRLMLAAPSNAVRRANPNDGESNANAT